MFEHIPVEVGLVHVGERIRKNDMQVELGGPSREEKFEIVRVITPGKSATGPLPSSAGISDMEEGKKYPLGILVEIPLAPKSKRISKA